MPTLGIQMHFHGNPRLLQRKVVAQRVLFAPSSRTRSSREGRVERRPSSSRTARPALIQCTELHGIGSDQMHVKIENPLVAQCKFSAVVYSKARSGTPFPARHDLPIVSGIKDLLNRPWSRVERQRAGTPSVNQINNYSRTQSCRSRLSGKYKVPAVSAFRLESPG